MKNPPLPTLLFLATLLASSALAQPPSPEPPLSTPAPIPTPLVRAPDAALLAQLPPAPEGFSWLLYKNCSLLRPAGWHYHTRPDDPAKNLTGAFALSPEAFSEKKPFEHGFTVQIHQNVRARFGAPASEAIAAFLQPLATRLPKADLLLYKENPTPTGATRILRHRDAPPGLTPLIIHRYYVANDTNDTLHVFTYESPEARWEENWKTFGTPILGKVLILSAHP
jgi:hypothetical protein